MSHTDHRESRDGRMESRRKFIARAAKAGLTVATAGGVAAWLHDPKGPTGRDEDDTAKGSFDYSLKNMPAAMAIATGADRAASLSAALDALGGIEKFIQPGDRVLLKVNAAFASPPILSATTHPDVIRELVNLCLRAGAREVRVSDNPINDPESCFRLTGIAEAAEKSGGRVVLPRTNCFKPFSATGSTLIRKWPVLVTPLDGIDKLIGVAPVKDHHRAGASMTMKNWYGLLGGRRNIFHQDVNTIITELAGMVRPTLVVLDGTTTMMTNGPTGGATSDLKATNTMIVSTDQVAADAFGSTLLGRRPADLPYIERAAAAGCGTADFESLKPARIGGSPS